jgi:hypothetical protein
MKEIRWWAVEEIEASLAGGVRIFPADLAGRMREFGAKRFGTRG